MNATSGIIVYSLYYMLCICGPTDLAKIEMLKNNTKYIGMLYCVLNGFQCVVQSLFLDEIINLYLDENIYTNNQHFFVISSINMACTLMGFASIFGLIRKEMKELKTFKDQRRRTHSSDYAILLNGKIDENPTTENT